MWHHNVDLLAYHDLDGRSGFKLALQEAGGRFFLYVAGFWHSGWSILEVTDPEHPKLLRWLAGPPNTMTLQVQVADGIMITALEHPPPGLTTGDPKAAPQDGFLIWDVREPDRPQLLGRWVSGGTGTHRNFYTGGPWVYATANLPGFEGQVLAIVDIADPANPKTAGTWWHPGQHTAAGETYTPEDQRKLTAGRPYPQHGLSLHGGAYALGDRAYCPWMRAGMVILDITDKHHPAHVATLPVYPPLGSTIAVHSAVPLPGRDIVVINSEALREHCDEPAGYVATVDISEESDPIVMAVFPPPRPPRGYDAPSFCAKGGRFGPHNQHQQQGLDCLAPNDRHVHIAYFNAGLQIYDISDPRDPHITGYYIPDDPKERRGPIPSRLVHQAQDVLVDRRGVIYMSEGNSGIYVFTHHASSRPPQPREGADMAIPAGIDGHAPVIVRHQIDINAPLDTVWRLQTDVNNWPAWQTDITAARLDGPFEPGNSFTWTSYGFTVTSTIYAVAERARTLWGGAANGIMGTHEWVYTPTLTGVDVATHESWSGQPVQADATGMQSALDKSLTDWLGHLKAAAERGSRQC